MDLFNKALLGKWFWRFLNEKGSLWVRILESRYGDVWDRGSVGVPRGLNGKISSWWKDVITISVGEQGGWMHENLERQMGDGNSTLFWKDSWIGEAALKDEFPRLFNVCLDKDITLGLKGSWVGSEWLWRWSWRMDLFEYEHDSLHKLVSLLEGCKLKDGIKDSWRWKGSSSGVFKTKEVYNLLLGQIGIGPLKGDEHKGFKYVWNKLVPAKVAAHRWRVLYDRVPTKSNLKKRGVNLNDADMKCVFCGEIEESSNHVFFLCAQAHAIWMEVYQWLNFPFVLQPQALPNLLAHCQIGRGKKNKIIVSCIWLGVIWVIWKWRNDIIFRGGSFILEKIIEEIRCRTWSWMLARELSFSQFSFTEWVANISLLIGC